MRKLLAIGAMVMVSGCSTMEGAWDSVASFFGDSGETTAPRTVVIKPTGDLTVEEKRFIIAKHYINHMPEKRWEGFQMLMNLAIEEFAPARDYYLAIRDTKPVLPGQSDATFAMYAEAINTILALSANKIKAEERQPCRPTQNFALLNTEKAAEEGTEQWLFDYCEKEVQVTVFMRLNPSTGNMAWEVPQSGIVIQ